MAKHKGKRGKGRQDAGSLEPPAPTAGAVSVTPREPSSAPPVATATARVEPTVADKGLRVEGNVIHLPSPEAPGSDDGSGAHPAAKADAEPPPTTDVSVLREAAGERDRATIPPGDKADEKAADVKPADAKPADAKPADAKPADEKPEATATEKTEAKAAEAVEAKTEAKVTESAAKTTDASADEKTEAKAGEKPERSFFEPAKAPAKEPAKTEPMPEIKSLTPTQRPGAKGDEKPTDSKRPKVDVTVGRKDTGRREHKESLSTHLSDEARAFFSEQAYQAAYKSQHDSFEDLQPAHEEHAQEVAHSRRWMTVSGGVFVALLAAVVSFAAYHSHYAVHETALDTTGLASRPSEPGVSPESQHAQAAPTPSPPEAPPTVTPPAPEVQPPAPAPEASDAMAGPSPVVEPVPAVAPSVPAVVEPVPAVAPAVPAVVEPVPAVAPAVPAVAPPVPAVAPSGQTPAQLLAAARSFRGAMPGRIAAYNTYFDAAPQDDHTMTTFATSLAEMGRNVDAEAVATRATTANPRNAEAWFIVAFARNGQHNVAGAREAKTRCIALGGQWAAECRAL